MCLRAVGFPAECGLEMLSILSLRRQILPSWQEIAMTMNRSYGSAVVMDSIKYLFVGLHGHNTYVPWMWSSMFLMLIGIVLLVIPACRKNENVLIVSCTVVFIGAWIDKGLGMISGGFVPNPLHEVNEYIPTAPELMISLAVWAAGFLVLTLLYKMVVSVKAEARGAA